MVDATITASVQKDEPFGRERWDAALRPEFEGELYQEIVKSSPGLMYCHDLDGVLLWTNPAAASSLGYTPQEAIGTHLSQYLAPGARSLVRLYLARIRRDKCARGFARVHRRDGEERTWIYHNTISDRLGPTPFSVGHALDITEEFRAEEASRHLFRHSPVGQMEIDASGKLRRINPAACEILGHSEFELFFAPGPNPVQGILAEIASGGESPRLVILKRKDGRVVHVEVHVRPLPAYHSSAGGVNCAIIDVSERVRGEMKIRTLNAQLEAKLAARNAELHQAKSELREFAYIASHDIQTPLNEIRARLQKLRLKVAEPEASAVLQQTETDVERMSKLVESILSFAVASNRTERAGSRVPLTVALEESLMNLGSVIASSEARISYANLPDILVDESDFVQLFQNLIGNALKYRSTDPPKVQISAAKRNNLWTISVQDNGIGIDPLYYDRIFDPFRRLHGKEYAGSGIGLAICKKIVERTGGKIWVESVVKQGSTFHFTIPS